MIVRELAAIPGDRMASSKSPFAQPEAGERHVRQLLNEVLRNVENLTTEHADAICTNDARSVSVANATRQTLETNTNQVRMLTDVPENMTARLQEVLTKGQDALAAYLPINPVQAETVDQTAPTVSQSTEPRPNEVPPSGHVPSHPSGGQESDDDSDLLSLRSQARSSSSSHGNADSAAQARRQRREAKMRLESEKDRLQFEIEISQKKQELERRELLRQLNELESELSDAEQLEQAKKSQPSAQHRASSVQSWVNSTHNLAPSPPQTPQAQPRVQFAPPQLNPLSQPFTPQVTPCVPQSPSASVAAGSSLIGADVATSLLRVNLSSHARDLVIQGRPPREKRFSGEDSIDLESTLNQFELATASEGVTDQMRYLELKHWVSGTAGLIVSAYDNERDPSEALRKAKRHLKAEFGRKVYTARQMLENLLIGGKLERSDSASIRVLIIKLEQVYLRAVETKRESSFSTAETYNEVLRRKLPFFAEKWAQRTYDHEHKYLDRDDFDNGLTFPQFIEYLRRQNSIQLHKSVILKHDNPTPTKPASGPATNAPKNRPKVAATKINIAATNSTNPKPRPQKSGSGAKKSYAAAATSTPQNPKPGMGVSASKLNHSKDGEFKCVACSGASVHELTSCREFLKMSDEERRGFVKSKGLCFLCLARGHMSNACTESISCKKCERKHNTIFHRNKPEEPRTESA